MPLLLFVVRTVLDGKSVKRPPEGPPVKLGLDVRRILIAGVCGGNGGGIPPAFVDTVTAEGVVRTLPDFRMRDAGRSKIKLGLYLVGTLPRGVSFCLLPGCER